MLSLDDFFPPEKQANGEQRFSMIYEAEEIEMKY